MLTPFVSRTILSRCRSYPEVSISDWVVAERGEAAEALSFSYVSGPYQSRRLANIELRRRLGGILPATRPIVLELEAIMRKRVQFCAFKNNENSSD
ncbi:hypothetical protein EZZ80_08550 [Pseudomonas putida]|nr:hypothetical protein DM483_26850 [Pseudomonas sp. SMT-1]QDW57319.1 hypothetical protein FFH79_010775 [Pseudomonas sp. KBS0802]UZA73540.1 hypothetical protein EZZ80_08550 [Pseudomonas putida]